MPIRTEQWRAGIASNNVTILKEVRHHLSFIDLLVCSLCAFAWLTYSIALSIITLPISLLVASFLSIIPRPFSEFFLPLNLQGPPNLFLAVNKVNTMVTVILSFLLVWMYDVFIQTAKLLCRYPTLQRCLLAKLHSLLYLFLISRYLEYIHYGERYPLHFLLLLAGDIETNPGPRVENFFKFFHWNLNSICARGNIKIPLIEAYNSVHHFDVIAISETMLDNSISDEDIFIEGFSREIYRSDHPSNTKLGGVCLYFREGLANKRRKDFELLQEMVVTEINVAQKKIIFVAIYRSPSQNSEEFENFISRLQMAITRIQSERPHAIIVSGDMNCRSSQWWAEDIENPEGSALDELIETNNLCQLIDEPTNIRGGSMSCIDLIITDQPNLFVDSGVHPSLDEHCQHQIIYGKLDISVPYPPPFKRKVWDYSKANVRKIRDTIDSIDWKSKLSDPDPEHMSNLFTKTLLSIFTDYIPNQVIKCSDKDPPWISSEIKTAIKRKHRVYKKFLLRGKRQEDLDLVKAAQYEATKMIQKAKENYYLTIGHKLSDPSHGIKAYWSVLNRLINKKKSLNIPPLLENGLFVTNPSSKANILNDYFVEQCSILTTGSTLPTFQPRPTSFLQNVNIDREEILKIIRSLDSNKAHGCDEISIAMIKICDSSIVEPLLMIYEKGLEKGVYPSIWKRANIIPVHKKNSRQCKKNYRPISLLPIFGKIFEKLIFDSVYRHLCDNNILTPHQSGFRPGDSTVNQLLSITHKIYTAFEAIPTKETRAVFLDLSKAFDRVWHEGLLYKLECCGISGNLLSLISNFLTNREQRVVLNGKNSEWRRISAGVPQGSVLGPLFFLVYINDLVENINSDIKLFADDTSLFSVVENVTRSADELNRDLERVRLWA